MAVKRCPNAKIRSRSKKLGGLLIEDRFSGINAIKKAVSRDSATEFTGLSCLSERLDMENKTIAMPRMETDGPDALLKYTKLIESMNYDLSVPPRVPFEKVEKNDYRKVEEFVFNRWKFLNREKIFERNIEVWRQFWIACERADTIAQIVDSRDPAFYFNEDICKSYPTKRHLLLCNKTDLVVRFTPPLIDGVTVHKYSTRDAAFLFRFSGNIALVGYPNVGKSSTINLILQKKKVRVSSTPGKTKHIQTIETENFTLFDCPGLVFPRHEKVDLVLHGVLNSDQISDLASHAEYILEKIGRKRIASHYGLEKSTGDLVDAVAALRSWAKSKCLRNIIKEYTEGLL